MKPFTFARSNNLVFRHQFIRPDLRCSASAAGVETNSTVLIENDESMSINALRQFFGLSIGKWNGFFYQFDCNGEMLQRVGTKLSDVSARITPFIGQWKGHSITKHSGVYGATIAEADTVAFLEVDESGLVMQDITSTSSTSGSTTNIHWCGTVSANIIKFNSGFQATFLPTGMYMGFPCNIGRSVDQ